MAFGRAKALKEVRSRAGSNYPTQHSCDATIAASNDLAPRIGFECSNRRGSRLLASAGEAEWHFPGVQFEHAKPENPHEGAVFPEWHWLSSGPQRPLQLALVQDCVYSPAVVVRRMLEKTPPISPCFASAKSMAANVLGR